MYKKHSLKTTRMHDLSTPTKPGSSNSLVSPTYPNLPIEPVPLSNPGVTTNPLEPDPPTNPNPTTNPAHPIKPDPLAGPTHRA